MLLVPKTLPSSRDAVSSTPSVANPAPNTAINNVDLRWSKFCVFMLTTSINPARKEGMIAERIRSSELDQRGSANEIAHDFACQ